MCDFPLNIANPLYGKFPDQFKRITVPCNKCAKCFTNRSNQWFIRLRYELKYALSAHFVTLTYANPPRTFNDLYTVKTEDLQNFFKRLRKWEIDNTALKYYAASEYGSDTQRPHYHAIIFNTRDSNNFFKAWSLHGISIGQIHIDKVEDGCIKYVTGYIGKRVGIGETFDYDDRKKEFSLMSKNMGKNFFLNEIANWCKKDDKGYIYIDNIKYPMPRYYKNLIYSDYKKRKISKTNYERYIQNKDKQAVYFGSINALEHNQRSAAQIRNQDKSVFNNNKL